MSVSSVTDPRQRPTPSGAKRVAATRWFRSYRLLTLWSLLRLRFMLPMILVVQIILSVGIVVGFAFLVPRVDQSTALYFSTGAPTLALISVGMVMAPAMLSVQKQKGIFDYQRSLPVPRTAMLAADATVWVVAAMPGVAAGLLVAALRFDLSYRISWLVVPAVLLVALTCMAIGYALAYAASPNVTQLVGNVLVFFTLMFSPIIFPLERLPVWLANLHTVLPFTYMAQMVRESLVVPAGGVATTPFAVLVLWCLAGLLLTHLLMLRRQ